MFGYESLYFVYLKYWETTKMKMCKIDWLSQQYLNSPQPYRTHAQTASWCVGSVQHTQPITHLMPRSKVFVFCFVFRMTHANNSSDDMLKILINQYWNHNNPRVLYSLSCTKISRSHQILLSLAAIVVFCLYRHCNLKSIIFWLYFILSSQVGVQLLIPGSDAYNYVDCCVSMMSW